MCKYRKQFSVFNFLRGSVFCFINYKRMNLSNIPFTITALQNVPFEPKTEEHKLYLTKKAANPLLCNISSGTQKLIIKLKLQRVVKQLKTIIFKNANSAFISISLGNNVVYVETQQFSLEQFQAKNVEKTSKLTMVKVNNRFTSQAKPSDEITIRLRTFYDCNVQHMLGLKWIEFIAM